MWCTFGFVVALGLDLFQYLVGASRTKAFGDEVEKRLEDSESTATPLDRKTEEFLYPDSHRTAMEAFWGTKVLVTLVTWIVLAVYIGHLAAHSSLPKLD